MANPALADKLDNLCRWIKGKSPGALRQKKYVAAVLVQLITDVKAWLQLHQLTDRDREIALRGMAPSQKYWFEFLLPQWFEKEDRFLPNWKQKLMQGEYRDDDEPFRNILVWRIRTLEGDSLWRFLMDLSMATDLIVSYNDDVLCVQYTRSSEKNTVGKRNQWEDVLRYWDIKRGIFVRVDPKTRNQGIYQLAYLSLQESDHLPFGCYSDFNID